jgi:DNA polymerase V
MKGERHEVSEKIYLCIDLKSFYASVECIQRGLDPMQTNLVVADSSRTEKTICLAVSPALKEFGVSGRARLFEVIERVKLVNARRRLDAPNHCFTESSYDTLQLKEDPALELSFITAPPQMALYMETSAKIYEIYLRYVAPEDIHVYSIDEVFIDLTGYLRVYRTSARELAMQMIREVYSKTGITATAGLGSNLYLAKIAMDIMAKRMKPDKHGARIAQLDEMEYRRQLWDHRPLTDFWRIGKGYVKRLEKIGLYTMGDVARCSLGNSNDFHNEELLYRTFGVNAELLIDHAWGIEPCTIADIKAYRPSANSISSGQVLHCPYSNEKAKLIVREMIDLLVLDLVEKRLVTDQIVLTVGYDIDNLTDPLISKAYKGPVITDHYGRKIPKYSHGTVNLGQHISSTKVIVDAVMDLFASISDPLLLVRRLTIVANHVLPESQAALEKPMQQLSLFEESEQEQLDLQRERNAQEAILSIRRKYGKNAILKGMNFKEGATTRDRNGQIGGHKA